jgi:hypothetical protein
MKEREEFLLGEENTSPAARTLFVSLDRADAIIEGASGVVLTPGVLIFSHDVRTLAGRRLPGVTERMGKKTGERRRELGGTGTDGGFSNERLGPESSQPDPGCIIFLSASI